MPAAPTAGVLAAPSLSQARVVFIDVARVLATLMMLFGHTVDALLSNVYRTTTAFNVWTFFRGLTPTTFTLVSGFALSLVALHHSRRETSQAAGVRRLRRFAFFLVLGYALHYPAANLAGLSMLTEQDWRMFTSVDVLQSIAVTLVVLQLIVLKVNDARRFLLICAVLTVVFCFFTPLVWRWTPPMPMALAAYFNPSSGSIFPLFPWLANGALGAALGAWFLLDGQMAPGARARRTLLPLGVLMLTAALLMRAAMWEPFNGVDLGAGRPSQFLLQAGLVCMLLTLLAAVVDLRPTRNAKLEDFAQESLTVYIVHVCVVYGSPWNRGLRQAFGSTLHPWAVGVLVLLLWAAMIGLGLTWSGLKRTNPVWAARFKIAVLGVLFVLLLV